MAVHSAGDRIVLGGVVAVEEAEVLCRLLCESPGTGVDLGACLHLHAAALQVLLSARPQVLVPPEDLFLECFILPLLLRGEGETPPPDTGGPAAPATETPS